MKQHEHEIGVSLLTAGMSAWRSSGGRCRRERTGCRSTFAGGATTAITVKYATPAIVAATIPSRSGKIINVQSIFQILLDEFFGKIFVLDAYAQMPCEKEGRSTKCKPLL